MGRKAKQTAGPVPCPKCGSIIQTLVILQAPSGRVTGYYRRCTRCGERRSDDEANADVIGALQHGFDKRRNWPQNGINHEVKRDLAAAYTAVTGDDLKWRDGKNDDV